ncbi:hypothetical protein [Streptomyces sp. YPW6]|uniref:hypothetical protein n=1 Tax=Streptomyces sp. YPW6 TaxID=2840373 RepID=UPI003D726503
MTTLHAHPLFDRLASSRRILVAGAGGGVDVNAGLPFALSLMHQGKEVQLANLTFSTVEVFREEVRQRPPRRIPH